MAPYLSALPPALAPHATPLLFAQAHGTAIRATVELGREERHGHLHSDQSPFDYLCRWTE